MTAATKVVAPSLWMVSGTLAGLAMASITAGTNDSISLLPIAADADVIALIAAFFT